ncbi:MAG: hypothetical protein JNM76_14600 [Betaproteobacteria bacterium]|nr:hypothetical protein [Betaproteobacteria bacterium]
MNGLQDGVGVRVAYKAMPTWGTLPGNTGAQLIDRVELTLNKEMAKIVSAEKRTSRQLNDARAGSRGGTATLRGQLKSAAFGDFLSSGFMNTWATGPTTGPLTTLSASASAPHFNRSSGSFITDGFKVGMIFRPSGFAGAGVPNNNKRFRITAVTALGISVVNIDGTAATVAAEVAGASVTFSAPGKILQVPSSGHVYTAFLLEKFHQTANTPYSMHGENQYVNTLDFSIDQDANIGIDVGFIGRRVEKYLAGASYFTSPTAAVTNRIMNSVYGALSMNGTDVGILTTLRQQITNNMQSAKAVFSRYPATVFRGRLESMATISAYLKDATFEDLMNNETEFALAYYFTSSPDFATADIMAVIQPRGQLFGVNESDADQGLIVNAEFQAKEGTGTGPEASTIYIQDTGQP